MRYILYSFKASEEYVKHRALDIIEGFWHEEEQLRKFCPDYSVDFGRFPITDDVSGHLSWISLRDEEGENQSEAGSSGAGDNWSFFVSFLLKYLGCLRLSCLVALLM